jgi:hypothetical protein
MAEHNELEPPCIDIFAREGEHLPGQHGFSNPWANCQNEIVKTKWLYAIGKPASEGPLHCQCRVVYRPELSPGETLFARDGTKLSKRNGFTPSQCLCPRDRSENHSFESHPSTPKMQEFARSMRNKHARV